MFRILLFLSLASVACTAKSSTEEKNWYESYDFDQDGQVDTIFFSFSGGAHCCYQIKIKLSSNEQLIAVPYDIEGGYMVFDLSQPNNFDILDIDEDNQPEIFIATRNIDGSEIERPGKRGIYVDFEKKNDEAKYFTQIKFKDL